VVYSGDPLRDLGLTAFLDKFVNKKPKVGFGEAHRLPVFASLFCTGGGWEGLTWRGGGGFSKSIALKEAHHVKGGGWMWVIGMN
jgi:hypothetical protein